MPDRAEPARVLGDALVAGARYYGALGRLAVRSAQALVPSLGRMGSRLQAALDVPADAASPVRGDERTMVVEAEAGHLGFGMFLVENRTEGPVSAPVTVSAFVDPSGRTAAPAVAFRPPDITLQPGEQVVVQVAAAVDETLEPGVRYRAEISVPGLSESRVPIVLRRRVPPPSPAPPS